MNNPALTVTDPTLYQYAYFLKKAAEEKSTQVIARKQFFMTELQRSADTLRQFLHVPAEPIAWDETIPAGRRKMVLRYDSGASPWQRDDGKIQVWVAAYELGDSYAVRIIFCHRGQGFSPTIFQDLHQQLPWQPDLSQAEWLGQSIFYAGISSASPQEVAQSVFHTQTLWHTSLTCGELYRRRVPNTPDLLIFPTSAHERLADEFFRQTALELGWYTHKGLSQERQYESYLHPAAEEIEQFLSSTLDEVQTLHSAIAQGDKDFDTVQSFHQHFHTLESTILKSDQQLTMTQNIAEAIQINVENYQQITTETPFHRHPKQDDVFTHQLHELERLPRQIQTDLKFWQRQLDQARNALDILRPVTERFPLDDRDPAKLTRSLQDSLRAKLPDFQHSKGSLTIMFDDIKDSTPYVEKHGDDQWQQLVQQHDTILHAIIHRYSGYVVKGLGDGSLSVFPDATDGVQAAIDIQSELKRHNAKAKVINQLHVRIGLHSGAALVGQSDVLGLTVSIAARVCGKADAGEIVMSEATYLQAMEIATDFEAMGPQTLKGVEKPMALYCGSFHV